MWTTANQRKDRKLRRTLVITSAEGKGIGNVGAGQARVGGNGVETARGKIVIAGWTGEPFVARPREGTTAQRTPRRLCTSPQNWEGATRC